jgi:hypothetical protein
MVPFFLAGSSFAPPNAGFGRHKTSKPINYSDSTDSMRAPCPLSAEKPIPYGPEMQFRCFGVGPELWSAISEEKATRVTDSHQLVPRSYFFIQFLATVNTPPGSGGMLNAALVAAVGAP